jgi:hypothetical protein
VSLFETNADALTGSIQGVSEGPKLGFGDAFSAAYDAQAKGSSVLAVSTALENAEAEQARKIEALGGKAPKLSHAETLAEKQMQGFDPYGDLARTLSDGGNERTQRLLADADARVSKLQEQYPDAGIKTYRELFDGVKQSAQKAEKDWNSANTSALGSVGGFLGGALAGMDPRTDPYNFGTLPIAGGGASVAGRIAVQAGVQGATEAVNQLTGVQENRRLLGLKEESAAGAITAAAVGGALFQGAGEAAFAAGKRLFPNSRWFRDAPHDPAPPAPEPEPQRLLTYQPQPGEAAAAPRTIDGVSEDAFLHSIARTNFDAFNTLLERDRAANPDVLGATRIGRSRSILDLDYVGRTLDDWRGPLPHEVGADTASIVAPDRYTFDVRPSAAGDTVDARARSVDPDTFALFDRAKQQAESFRQQIAAADDRTVQANRGALDTVEATLAAKQDQLSRARSAKTQERLNAEIAELTQQRDNLARDTGATSAELRAELVRIDHQMRDLAPVVSRAYAAANGQLSAEANSDAARFLADIARSSPRIFPETAARAEAMAAARPVPPLVPRTVVDDVPLLASRPSATAALGPGADAADRIAAVMKQVEAERDTSTDAFRATAKRLVEQEGDATYRLPSGKTLHLDNDRVPSLDGTRDVSVRQYLDELRQDEEALQGVSTCSKR